MDDLISRQAAIDAVHEDILLKSLNDSWYRENHEFVTVGYVERTLLAVPSAQPDKDMIHLQREQAYMQGWEDGQKALREEIWEDGRDRLD